MTTVDRVRELLEPLLAERSLELYDLDQAAGSVRVTLETSDLEAIAELTRALSRALDEADPIDGHYTLEVSSPGLERTLRTPAHFAGAVGDTVAIKTVAGTPGERRLKGVVLAAADDTVTVRDDATMGERTLRYAEIERARTVFEWGPTPKPGQSKSEPKSDKKATAR